MVVPEKIELIKAAEQRWASAMHERKSASFLSIRRWKQSDAEKQAAAELGKAVQDARSSLSPEEQIMLHKAELQAIEWKPLWGKPAMFAGAILVLFIALFRQPKRIQPTNV
jgi:hypothetical protein